MAGWTDRSPESSRSDTFSNSSENQTAHSKPISFQTLHLLKREEVAYYPAGNETGGNAFSFCYQSLMPLAYLQVHEKVKIVFDVELGSLLIPVPTFTQREIKFLNY